MYRVFVFFGIIPCVAHLCIKIITEQWCILLNKDITVQVSDTTEDESSNTGGLKKTYAYKRNAQIKVPL